MWPIQLAFLLLLFLYARCSSPLRLFVTLLYFSHDRSNWSSTPFSTTTFQHSPSISALLSEVSNFQRHLKLYSKCKTSLVYSLTLCPICWWKESSCWILLLPRQFWIQFHVCIIYYNTLFWRHSKIPIPATWCEHTNAIIYNTGCPRN